MKLSEYLELPVIPKSGVCTEAGSYRQETEKLHIGFERDSWVHVLENDHYPYILFVKEVSFNYTTELVDGQAAVVWQPRTRLKMWSIDGP